MKKFVFCLILLVSNLLYGQVTQYNDRASWLAAAGTPDLVEDFEGFVADADFKLSPVTLTIGTIQQMGEDEGFRNLIDSPPLDFPDNGGTSHASCFVNFPESNDGTTVMLTFDQPVSAWGAQLYGVQGAELAAFDVLDAISTLIPISQDQFIGFTSTTPVTAIEFRAQNLIAGGTGEGFGVDDMEIAFDTSSQVPTLGQWGSALFLLIIGAAALFFLRRNR